MNCVLRHPEQNRNFFRLRQEDDKFVGKFVKVIKSSIEEFNVESSDKFLCAEFFAMEDRYYEQTWWTWRNVRISKHVSLYRVI